VPRGTQGHFAHALRLSPTGLSPCAVGLPRTIRLPSTARSREGPPTPPGQSRTVWAVPLSLATTRGMVSFPGGTKMFQFPPFPPRSLCVQLRVRRHFRRRGFPHSDIPGSLPAHGSPRLFAVYHVLLRRLTPRHPPCALSSLVLRKPRRSCVFALPVHYSVVKLRRAETTNGLTGPSGRL
jgi:hypothetical protein